MIIWLASYPKSGNTWIRYFIISLLVGNRDNMNLNHLKAIATFPTRYQFKELIKDPLNLEEIKKNWITAQSKLISDKQLRFLKTHNTLCCFGKNCFTNLENTLGTIHIVRDPRNVITSLKNHMSLDNYEEALKFISDERMSLDSSKMKGFDRKTSEDFQLIQLIGNWKTHYLSWKKLKKNKLLVKYENLINNPKVEFCRISDHLEKLLNTKFKDSQVDKAIKNSSFKRLREMEEKHGFSEATKNEKTGNKNKFFYLGPKNEWKNILDKKIVDDINKKFEPEMKELGYL